MIQLSLIVAASNNHAIGKNNDLLWHLPNDMKFFKQTTWAMPVIMGRKTWDSLKGKALNGRLNIVITSQENLIAKGAVVVHNIDDALFVAQQHLYKEAFIIGGGQIYKETIKKANKIYLTKVDTIIDGDTFIDAIDESKFTKIQEQKHLADEKHLYNYSFETWKRKD